MPSLSAFLRLAALMLVLAWPGLAPAAELETFSYEEPFGLAHVGQVLDLALAKPVDAANCRLLDSGGNDVPFQIAGGGGRLSRLLVRTDLAPRQKLTWLGPIKKAEPVSVV